MEKKSKPIYQVKIIVDTNIVFSVLLNTNGTIGDLLFNSNKLFEFYSCAYMQHEIDKHWGKLKRISKLSELELAEARFKVFKKINFINEELIPKKTWILAERLAANIDIDDTDFIALTKHIKGYLWTGDKKLYSALKRKHFKQIFNTSDLVSIRKSKS